MTTENTAQSPGLQPGDPSLSLLASVRRALDDKLVVQRTDVLIEAVLVALAKIQPASTTKITQHLCMLFRTTALPASLAEAAINDAYAAGLLRKTETLLGTQEWVLTESAARDVREDTEWATAVIESFDREAGIRLLDDPERDQIGDERVPRVAEHVRRALALGCQGLYDVQAASTPAAARPLTFNERSALDYLKSVQPRSVRTASERLLIAALNPDDNFGDAYIHLLVACNVLHAMATRRDLSEKPSMVGLRLVLDTSSILDLACPGTPLARTVEEAIRLTVALGAEVVVPDHVIEQWMGLFAAADREVVASLEGARLGSSGALAVNPFVRFFHADDSQNANITWAQYRHRWQDPSTALKALGAKIRPHFNSSTDVDCAFYNEVARSLTTLNRQRAQGGRKPRTTDGIRADANSITMVARWRREGRPDAGFFVARDRMSSEAYRQVEPGDLIPLVVTLPAWLLFVVTLTVDDPNSKVELAHVIGNAALRDSFFALSSCYTYDEIVSFSELLRADDYPIGAEDITTFIQQRLERLEEQAGGEASPSIDGGRVLQARALKRNQRARRSEESSAAALQDAVREVENTNRVHFAANELEHARDRRVLEEKVQAGDEALRREADRRRMYGRSAAAFAATCALIIAAALLWGRLGVKSKVDRAWLSFLFGVFWVAGAAAWVKAGTRKVAAYAATAIALPLLAGLILEFARRIR